MARSQITLGSIGESRLVEEVKEQPNPNSGSLRKMAFLLLGFALSSAALWYVFRDIEATKLLELRDRIEILPLVGSVVLYWTVLVITRSFLIRHLLDSKKPAPIGKIYKYICIGFLSNSVLPARMGEVVRAVGIAKVSKTSFISVAGSVTLERLLDFAWLAVLGVAALTVAPLQQGIRITIFVLGGGLTVAFTILIFLARRDLKPMTQTGKQSYKVLVWNLIVRFTGGLKSLASSNGIYKAVTFSAIIWVTATAVLFLRLIAFGFPPNIPMTLVLITSISLGVSLPSAPAYVGVYHMFAAGALILFGVDERIAVGFAVLCHLADIIPACILGAISMLLEGVSFADLKRRPDK